MNCITFYGNTDLGRNRSNNEDAFIAQSIWDNNHILAVAIDGVGGYEGGEVASALAQKCIVEYLETYSNGERLELLKQAVINANNTIFTERKNNPQYSSMSCVLTAVLVELKSKRVNMAHVGDTRLYRCANGKIEKLSHDHSLVGYREEIGELTEEEAMRHPQRNIIGRDVGSSFLENSCNDYVETATFDLVPNSTLLLCSDGLCDMITSAQMRTELEKALPVPEKANNLIKAANEAGGKDNITVVLVEYIVPGYVAPPAVTRDMPQVQARRKEETTTQPVVPEQKVRETVREEVNEVQEEQAAENRRPYLRIAAIAAVALLLVAAGYLLGGFTGNRLFPTLFPKDTICEVQIIELNKDSVRVVRKFTVDTQRAETNAAAKDITVAQPDSIQATPGDSINELKKDTTNVQPSKEEVSE